VCWRLSLLLLLGACAALIACTYWGWRADENVADLDAWTRETGHADASGRVGLWLLIACPVPGLAEAALWLLWPRSLRRQIRPARDRVAIAEALADPYRFLADTPAVAARRDFDPTCGAYGLPRPIVAPPAPEEYGKPLALRRGKKPLRGRAYRLDPDPLDALLVWDGGTLFLDDGAGRMVRVPLRDTPQDKAPLPHGRRSPVRTLAQRPASMAHVTEKVRDAYVRNSDLLLLLDGDGRRLLALPAQALEDRDLAAISAAARLPFAAYDLGRARDADLLTNRLFPSRRRAP
jgi:hypothetical protein